MANIYQQRTINELRSAAAAMKGSVFIGDIRKAMKQTLVWYIRHDMKKRFMGRKYNPRYPRLKFATAQKKRKTGKPILVEKGLLKRTTLKSARVAGTKKMSIRVRVPKYGEYLRNRGFDYINPNSRKDEKLIRRKFFQNLKKIRMRRVKRTV